MKKIVYGVGLTGGHIYPALALAEELGHRDFEHLFVARSNSPLAQRLVRERGYPLLELNVSGMPRSLGKFFIQGLGFAWGQAKALGLCRRALRDWRPDLAVGFGGYVSAPLILGAKSLGLRTLLFEPNARFGLANIVLSFVADQTTWAMGLDQAGSRAKAVAPPLRLNLKEAKSLAAGEARRRLGLSSAGPCLFVFGGSQGASVINGAAGRAIAKLRKERVEFSFLHVTGSRDFADCQCFYQREGLLNGAGRCLDYFEDIGIAYQGADLVISRAGAMTCLELMEFGRRCLLIPFAGATEAHQWANARYLEQSGIAKIFIEDGSLDFRLEAALREELAIRQTPAPRPRPSPPALAQLVRFLLA